MNRLATLLTFGLIAAATALPAAAGELDLSLPASSTPIGFARPDQSAQSALPAGDYDRGGLDTGKDGHGFDVSGSVSTGIGYTKGYGNSNFSDVHLRVSKDDGDDRPSRFTLDLDVGTSRGPGFGGYGGYGGYGYGPYGPGYGDYGADEARDAGPRGSGAWRR